LLQMNMTITAQVHSRCMASARVCMSEDGFVVHEVAQLDDVNMYTFHNRRSRS